MGESNNKVLKRLQAFGTKCSEFTRSEQNVPIGYCQLQMKLLYLDSTKRFRNKQNKKINIKGDIMKSQIINLVTALTLIVGTQAATANTEKSVSKSPAWICSLNFNGVSKGVQIIIGFSEFKGSGTLKCKSAANEKVTYPVVVKMGASPIAPAISLGYMELYGEALQFALSNGTPEALLGDYLMAQGRASIIGGVGVITAVRAAQKDLSLTISLQLVHGLGLDLGFTRMNLSLASK
jgi:hypothetical protein